MINSSFVPYLKLLLESPGGAGGLESSVVIAAAWVTAMVPVWAPAWEILHALASPPQKKINKIALVIQGLLWCAINSKITYSSIVRIFMGVLIGIALNL